MRKEEEKKEEEEEAEAAAAKMKIIAKEELVPLAFFSPAHNIFEGETLTIISLLLILASV